ncbi:MAG TPA: gluconate 2-dehydrogenase subunit 3 family protein [Vicinamibacterales bacterium]|nr:gluconate 2-dehydrogenase subunit 3 family protein [Vicinamibacterales bacterium]
MPKVTRRAALKALGTTAALLPALSPDGLAAYARIQAGQSAPVPKLLSAREFDTLELLVEAIIPTDERSPGAREARVADYIDLLLSESEHDLALQWIGGLAALDREAVSRFAAPFARLTPDQVDAILADISRNESDPATPLERFFVMTKQATVRGYYSSEIGIHRELRYQGNQFLQTFVGCATEDGQRCPHCGQEP